MLALPKHPIPMRTTFRDCFLVNFAVDPDVLRALLPKPIEPELHQGSAFLSVVMVTMDRMRPAFLPPCIGISYTQVLYRALVTCQGERGVHFLRTDTDNRLMCRLGNVMTIFPFSLSQISQGKTGPYRRFDLKANPTHHAHIHALFDLSQPSQEMPPTSRFASLPEARKFFVERYAAFSIDRRSLNTVRIRRGDWNITVVPDLKHVYQFMRGSQMFPEGCAELDCIFHVEDVAYYWTRLEKRRLR